LRRKFRRSYTTLAGFGIFLDLDLNSGLMG
jgi:hypothetical protein